MASPPYSIDATAPDPSSAISGYPTTEQSFRDIVKSWLEQIADPTTGALRGAGVLTALNAATGTIDDDLFPARLRARSGNGGYTDLNDVVEAGFYGLANSVSNLPSVHFYTVLVLVYPSSPNWIRQIAFRLGTSDVYTREYNGTSTTWTAWTKIALTEAAVNALIAPAFNASNLSSGTVPAARLSGVYAISITGSAATATSATSATNATNATNLSRSVLAGTGLTGGGQLNANVTLNVDSTVWRTGNQPSKATLTSAMSGGTEVPAFVYTGATANQTNLPIGSIIFLRTTGAIQNNANVVPYISDTNYRSYTNNSSATGGALAGTWRMRGWDEDALGGIAQRVA